MCSFCARAAGDVTGERRVEGGGGSSGGKGGGTARDLEDGGGGVAASCGKRGGVEGPREDDCGGVAEASGGTDAGLCRDEGGGGRRDGIAEGRIVCAAPELGGGRLDGLDGTTDERLCDGTTDERPCDGTTDERLCDGTTDERLCDGTTDERLACGALAAGAGWLGEVEERDGGGGCGRTEGRGGVSSSENGVMARAEAGGGAGVAGREVEAGGGVGVDPVEADCV